MINLLAGNGLCDLGTMEVQTCDISRTDEPFWRFVEKQDSRREQLLPAQSVPLLDTFFQNPTLDWKTARINSIRLPNNLNVR
jgi:hypothetical protein